MKKIFTAILASAMMFVATDAFAQFHVGLGYANSSTILKIDSEKNTTAYNGFQIGGGYDFHIVKGLSIAPSLYYSYLTTGEKELVNILGAKVTAKNQEHFINLPVDVKYGFDIIPAFRLSVFAGPTFQFQVGQKYQVKAGNNNWSDTKESDDLSKFDVLLGGGISADILDFLRVDLGYRYGLVNLYKGDLDKVSEHRSQVVLGVSFVF